jgi:putative transposase
MQRLQTSRYELMPTGKLERDLWRFAGSCRFVFNKIVALQTAKLEAGNELAVGRRNPPW